MDAIPAAPADEPRSLRWGVAWVIVWSAALTAAVAWPVLASPATMMFGHELAGRHHDPFTVMFQFAAGGAAPPYWQPLTDTAGVWLARVFGPVPAYNALTLASFPVTAVTTYLLSRYLTAPHRGALVAALVFAFAPVHVAQAAYHVHIAQMQWIPLFLLALIAAVDRPSAGRLAALAAATVALATASAYFALMGVVLAPVTLATRWLHQRPRQWTSLWRPAATLAAVGLAGLAAIAIGAPVLMREPARFAFPAEDVGRYGATWWAYLAPPLDHPVLGGVARSWLQTAGAGVGLLEHQLSLGWAWIALAAYGLIHAPRALRPLVAAGVVAFVVSLAPPSGACAAGSLVPSCLLHDVAPMFRAFSRFGIVAALSVALLAGYAVAAARARAAVAALLIVGAVETWPFTVRARDVLPTAGHRWIAEGPADTHVLDCAPRRPADQLLPWLMQRDVQPLDPTAIASCDDSDLAGTLAATGFTHMLRRADSADGSLGTSSPGGMQVAAAFPDAVVYRVTAAPTPVVIRDWRGFYPQERHAGDRWRWMGPSGSWTAFNATPQLQVIDMSLTLGALLRPRELVVTMDEQEVARWRVSPDAGVFATGPVAIGPGAHTFALEATEPATSPAAFSTSRDSRPLTVRLYAWTSRHIKSDTITRSPHE